MRVAAQIAIGKGKVQAQRAVVAAEPVAPVVADAGVLGLAAFGVDLARRRLQAEVAVADLELAAVRIANRADEQAARLETNHPGRRRVS